jgi:putative nucleotidyltransferase with HDIG domain
MENLEDTIVDSLQHLIELRSKEEGGHSLRTAILALYLAKAVDVPSESLAHIRRGMLLHDIGKIGIPDQILFKMGPLYPEEWKHMRNHPENGFSMLTPLGFLTPALDIIRYHHENWDGSGYPRGLRGEQIPFLARIAALAEVWDALTCDLHYRPAWGVGKALGYFEAEAERKFDPEITRVFVRIMREKGLAQTYGH